MPIILNNLESREGLTNIPIANILGPNSDEVYSFSSGWASLLDAFSITNNIVSLNEGWNLDFETKSVVNAQFSVNDGNINGFNSSYYNLNLPGDTTDVNIPLVRGDGLFYDEFLSFNIEDVDESVTFTTVDKVNENEYGAIIGTVTPNSPDIFNSVTINGSDGFYAIEGDKIKLKDEYLLNSDGWIDKNPSNSIWGYDTKSAISEELYLGVGSKGYSPGGDFNNGLSAMTNISTNEQKNIFTHTDKVSEITVTPIPFIENKLGEIIAEISIPDSSANSFHLLKLNDPANGDFNLVPNTHNFLELIIDSDTYKIKLKDDYFYNHNTGEIRTKENADNQFSYFNLLDQTEDDGSAYNSLYISALDANNNLLVTEDVQIQEVIGTVFSNTNIIDQEHSHPWITDIKFQKPDLPNTGREEYQKNVDYHWVLKDGEKIQYSFLDNNSTHHGTYAELEGDGLIEPTQAFKDSYEKALNNWSKFIDVQFEEIEETNENVGDWRIGITDKDHFMPGSVDDPNTPENEAEPWVKYAAYSQGVTSSPVGGNMFYNGFISNDGTNGFDNKDSTGENIPDGILDWNQENNMTEYSNNFNTLIHEIGHSLGLKHPFEEFPTTSDLYGNGDNIFQDKHDQMKYSVMTYTSNRDYNDPSSKYDGTQLKLPDGTLKEWESITPMLYDVMSLQEVYGPAASSSPDHDLYIYTPDKIPYECIYDTGGNDILDLSALEGGSNLKLNGDELSTVGQDYLIPWRHLDEGGSESGTPQGGVLGIINASSRGGSNTEIETIKLPSDLSVITTGDYSTCVIGKSNTQIELTLNSDQLGVKAFGEANDIIRLAQTTKNWGLNVKAKHTGNDGKGATNIEIQDMTKYLKHDLSVDLAGGMNSLMGTEGNDAIFLNNLVTKGNAVWLEEMGEDSDQIYSGNRLIGVKYIDLGDGDNLLDLSGQNNSLAEEAMIIKVGSGQDTLWLSDGDENVDTGSGNDNIIVNGGIDNITTGDDNDIITVADNIGNLTITDFDPNKDKLVFSASQDKVSIDGELITVNNSLGDYVITLTGNVLSDLSSDAFSFVI